MLEFIGRISSPLELAVRFKSAVSRVPSSAALVTTIDENGRPHGLAPTTFLSVSTNAASALICVNRSASASPLIKDRGVFYVVLLQSIHEQIGARFSRPDDRDQLFINGRWRTELLDCHSSMMRPTCSAPLPGRRSTAPTRSTSKCTQRHSARSSRLSCLYGAIRLDTGVENREQEVRWNRARWLRSAR